MADLNLSHDFLEPIAAPDFNFGTKFEPTSLQREITALLASPEIKSEKLNFPAAERIPEGEIPGSYTGLRESGLDNTSGQSPDKTPAQLATEFTIACNQARSGDQSGFDTFKKDLTQAMADAPNFESVVNGVNELLPKGQGILVEQQFSNRIDDAQHYQLQFLAMGEHAPGDNGNRFMLGLTEPMSFSTMPPWLKIHAWPDPLSRVIDSAKIVT